ncbi:hypothetical protein E8E12_000194 [Didymella heteroderae]|uniref:Uncharacterized protein n=1 Tax=Didymella heteroderae TaxID=1769908 RepID=A0A9P5BTN3_9PLEO|nr:hypothetical protein E8E12_000194 [Didymella heteroderae]
MLTYDPQICDSVRFYSYGSPYYVFVLDNEQNEVVIYDPKTSKVVFRASFPFCDFTSMVTNEADVYIGLTTGQILKLEQDSRSRGYREVVREKRTGSDREPIGILGISDLIMFTGSECTRERDWTEWKIVNVTIEQKYEYKFNLGGVLECSTFSKKKQELLAVVKSESQRCLQVISIRKSDGIRIPVWRTYNLPDSPAVCPTLTASAVSSKGDVALRDRGLFRIVNPIPNGRLRTTKLKRKELGAPLFVDNVLKTDKGGQTSFVGAEDEYLVYCEYWSSKIAVAKHTEHGWEEKASWHFETGSTFSVRHKGRTYSNIHNPGWDGEKIMVRIGPDGFAGDMSCEKVPSMLLALDVSQLARPKPLVLTRALTNSRRQDGGENDIYSVSRNQISTVHDKPVFPKRRALGSGTDWV